MPLRVAVPRNPVAEPPKAKLLVPASPDWYNFLPPLSTTSKPVFSQSASQLVTLLNRASSLHASELSIFSARPNAAAGSSASDQAFQRNILASGTLSDRLSVLTLMAQGAPLHNGRGGVGASQDTEKSKGKTAGREDRLKAARAIMDWWIGGGTPNRKLKYFRDQPLLHPDVTDQHLVIWYFEDWLKKYFFSYLQILEAFSLDPLPYVRTQSLNLIATLLRSNPEQEQNLLRLLVNKLGDTESAICARTSYHLLHILQEHPAMKAVVIRETTALIMRPNPPSALPMASHLKSNTHNQPETSNLAAKQEKGVWHVHARYYATITFNQIVLSTSEVDRTAARTLIDVYFQLFREVVGERQPGTADDAALEQLTDKGKQKKKPKFIKGKDKEVRGAAGFAEVQDSNARLVSAILTGVNRALPYAQFRGADAEFDMHIGTLFLLVHTSTFNISLRALTLLQQIASSFPATSPIVSRFYRALYATLLDPRLYTTRNQALFLNLLFKSLKADAEKARVMAFVKRFCQLLASGSGGSEFVAGGLWLLGELFTSSPGLCTLIDKASASPVVKGEEYDPYKREPQYSHAQSSPLWELTTLLHHAHPTVALLARQLLSHEPLTTSSDLTLYTLAHFLDRFVYKNPKKAGVRGASAMQPSTTGGADGVRRVRADIQETPLNIDGWWRRGEGAVPVDQAFFQRFFSQKHAKEKARATKVDKRRAKRDSSGTETDGESNDATSDEDSNPEAEIWKVMKASMPKASPNCNDDSDDDDNFVEDSISGSELNDPEGDEEDQSDAERDSNICDYEDGLSVSEASHANDLVDPTKNDEVGCNAEERTSFSDSKKRKRDEYRKEDVRTRRKKLRSLPAFASYEDYARIIEDEPEENL
ncbi:CBF/Mak21 family-domain-containing protein [Lactifluus subvellereus]|nr:CBF/Mak21 family-domain-containing protein [Lactifluus subvellereus]